MLDQVDQSILRHLVENARMSIKEIAQQVGLSSPSISDRIRRLEERGIIRGYTLDIDPKALGFPLQAIVHIRPLPGKLHAVQQLIEELAAFGECDKVTGDDCYFARLYIRSIEELDTILNKIVEKAETRTSIVKSQPVLRRPPPF
ncbi:Lrp/AsnC family transcriptional regulator [Roseinatronobacter alkalisoli]|nr:Lrp/AsnC family transcriptional regulator [Roseinatronobacter sp. HJB301]